MIAIAAKSREIKQDERLTVRAIINVADVYIKDIQINGVTSARLMFKLVQSLMNYCST